LHGTVLGSNLTTRQIVDSPAVELRYSEADEAFRAELRTWLDATLPALSPAPPRDAWADRRKWDTDWQRRLFDAGYAGLHWPDDYGGRGATPTEQLIFYEETAQARAPDVGVNFVGLLHAGPTLIEEGNDAQKAEHLPKILRGEEVWCQGFSEPGAGSDLASLRTHAECDGDDYILNGQKIWCSFGHIADVGEFLVRTDPDAPKHKGISWLILPMDTPGIEVRPLRTVLGSSEFSEVFLTDVRVPVANRVGAENDGWRVTNVTLKYERGTAFVGELVDSMRLCAEFASLARGRVSDHEIGHCIAEFDALWALTKRNVSQSARGVMGPGAMVIKLAYSEARQHFGELCIEALGQGALHVDDNELVEERLRTLALTIAAGSSQIQRNIIGERLLGLPREPR
jgi:alkylation response protein AidB-like acyl-CoA dehydrogenase